MNSPWIWLIGLGLFFLVLIINSKRWQILLSFEEVKISFIQSFQLSLMGLFFNFFMPGGAGGDVVKAGYLMGQYGGKRWFIGWSALVDRLFGLSALLLYAGVTGVLFKSYLEPPWQKAFFLMGLVILMGFGVLLLVLNVFPKKKAMEFLQSHPWLEKSLLPLFYFFQKPKQMILPFLMSLLSQAINLGMGIFLVYHLQVTLPLWMLFLLFPFGFLATILPLSPAGLGVGQLAFYSLFHQVAGQGDFGVLMISFYQAVQFLFGVLGGLLFVLYRKGPRKGPSPPFSQSL